MQMIIIADEEQGLREEGVHKVGGSSLPLAVPFLSIGKCHEEVKKKIDSRRPKSRNNQYK